MLSVFRLVYLVCVLAATVRATIKINGDCIRPQYDGVKHAISDALEVARVAAWVIGAGSINGKADLFAAAYEPLMYAADRPGLALILGKLAGLGTTRSTEVTIFCEEHHVVRVIDDPKYLWYDTAYRNKVGNGPMYLPIRLTPDHKKPGVTSSYTTQGFKQSDAYDCSGQAHIFLHRDAVTPHTSAHIDTRRYGDIVRRGLDGKHHRLEQLEPLALVVLHELLHVTGGLSPPDPVKKIRHPYINDGPDDQHPVYGWAACNARRLMGLKNSNIADCIAFVAQAIYFSRIQGRDTYWTTGEVDPKTLRPKQRP